MFILVILTLILTLNFLWLWRADRLLRWTRHAPLWRCLSALFVLAQLGLIIWLFVGVRTLGRGDELMPKWLYTMLFVWSMLVLPVVLVSMMFEQVYRTIRRLIHGKPAAPPEPPPAHGISRRTFIRGAVAAAPPVMATFGTGFALSQLDEFRIRRLDIPLAALPAALNGLTIAHVTDVHVGDFTNGRTLQKIAQATNELRADLVLMTGDLINRRISDLPAAMDMVTRMDARHGLFMCQGNHDLFEGREVFSRGVRSAGTKLLTNSNETLRINGQLVQILGLQWGFGDGRRSGGNDAIGSSMPSLLAQRNPQAFPIMLAHHPHAFDWARQANIPLTLAGHTHGGQLMATHGFGFGPWMYKYWSGLYREGDAACVVSNGVGNWFPLRINAPAEIAHITLRSA